MIIQGNRPELLRDLLISWVKHYPLSPLENETILVQSNGIGQWLKLALAADESKQGCSIAAALEMSLPSRFIWRIYRAVLGNDAVPEVSSFDKTQLIWRLMRLLPKVLSKDVYAPLRRYLEDDDDQRKRFQLAERLADLFDQYQVYRADWLDAWANHQDILLKQNKLRDVLPEAQQWQPDLWRQLIEDVAKNTNSPHLDNGRAATHAAFMTRVADASLSKRPSNLPRRVLVFGISTLPQQALEALTAISRWVQILVCVHNPCEHYWANIIANKEFLSKQTRQSRRSGMPVVLNENELHLHAHPLLAAWGKQGRDFISLLEEHDNAENRAQYEQAWAHIQGKIDLFSDAVSPNESSLLQQIQDDIRDLRPLHETQTHWPAIDTEKDHSIRFHIAHSPLREVEILHDQLLDAFQKDHSLQPRDVLVMVPDIQSYAPYIQAVFDLHDKSDPRFIPFSITDQTQRNTQQIVRALESLLNLPASRFTVSDVFDLLDVSAIRTRFNISESDLPQLRRWVNDSNIRCGLNTSQIASLDLPTNNQDAEKNTWIFGLKRMLLGYAVGSIQEDWQDIVPYGEIGGGEAALLGSLIQFIELLEHTWKTLNTTANVSTWCERLRALASDFFSTDAKEDAYLLMQFHAHLDTWQTATDASGFNEALPLSIVKTHCLSQFEENGLSNSFFFGTITFANLMPMRAIPFRHIALLGMNDGDYPRAQIPMNFDLMRHDYRFGDRSRREDDHYLFLEALLSARDKLHISWVGRSITDNSERPPSVLVGQLRDHISNGWEITENRSDARGLDALTVAHPLQAFSAHYFSAKDESPHLFTFSHEWRRDAQPNNANAPIVPLTQRTREQALCIRDLVQFLRSPVQHFFQQRFGVYFDIPDSAADLHEPFELDALQNWQIRDELASALRHASENDILLNVALDTQLRHIEKRGDLAHSNAGKITAEALHDELTDFFAAYQALKSAWPTPCQAKTIYHFDCPKHERHFADSISDILRNASNERARIILETRRIVSGKNITNVGIISHWITHIVAHLNGEPLTTFILLKDHLITLPPLSIEFVHNYLERLIDIFMEGQCAPLPFATRTALTYLQDKKNPIAAAEDQYEGTAHAMGELTRDAYLQRAYPQFSALIENDQFITLAEQLLVPLLHAAEISDKKGKAS